MSTTRRDYSLTGPEYQLAADRGLVDADWYVSPIPRERLRELMRRRNGPAIRDTIIWIALLVGLGTLAVLLWGSWWCLPVFLLYGIVYMSPADSRWHECGHGTAFRTSWMNTAVYHFASFLAIRPGTPWRWSHMEHHSDTIIVGRDPEIVQRRPPILYAVMLETLRVWGVSHEFPNILRHALGSISDAEKTFLPQSHWRKTIWEARLYLLLWAGIIGVCFAVGNVIPLLLVGLPALFGGPLFWCTTIAQHLGLHEDVLDHRLNSRTVYMNPVVRFLYWNMNYHVEHHMFPTVPYHALPALHEEMKADTPEPCPSLPAAMKEVLSALAQERKDPTFVVSKPLPPTARPYRYVAAT